METLAYVLARDAIVVSDVGNCQMWGRHYLPINNLEVLHAIGGVERHELLSPHSHSRQDGVPGAPGRWIGGRRGVPHGHGRLRHRMRTWDEHRHGDPERRRFRPDPHATDESV